MHGPLNIKHFFALTKQFDFKQMSSPYNTNSFISNTFSFFGRELL